MQAFIYGGSGKSALAEKLMQGFADVPDKLYIATMWPEGAEAKRRIARHQAMRANKGFATIEQYTGLDRLQLPPGCAVLLECLGNLVANEMFAPEGVGFEKAENAITKALAVLQKQAEHLVIVSNDVGGDGTHYAPETKAYQLLLAKLNRQLCTESDVSIEMVCGIPIFLKGEKLCPSFAR